MPWMLTIEIDADRHGHIAVPDPSWAAIVLGLLNDLRRTPCVATLTPWSIEWRCPRDCGAWRFDTDPRPDR